MICATFPFTADMYNRQHGGFTPIVSLGDVSLTLRETAAITSKIQNKID
jgi:hypothetical protein